MLYTPAIICGLSWQGGSLQPKELRVRGCLLTALPGVGETSPSLKGGSGRQMSAFTTVHTWHCTDPLRLCSRSCSSRIPMGLPGGKLEMKVSGMKYRPHPAAGLGTTLILIISLLHDPFWITLTLNYHLCMSQWTTWWQDPITEGSGLLVTMPSSGQDGCTCPFTITVEQEASKWIAWVPQLFKLNSIHHSHLGLWVLRALGKNEKKFSRSFTTVARVPWSLCSCCQICIPFLWQEIHFLWKQVTKHVMA